jgi:hypothetical protein
MNANVTFRHSTKFAPASETDGTLAIDDALWFVSLLRQISNLQIDDELCQEDWGVVIFAKRNKKRFWIGLYQWSSDNTWIAQFHHGSFAWRQMFSRTGKAELNRLLLDFHEVLASEPCISEIIWYQEAELKKANPSGHSTPIDE